MIVNLAQEDSTIIVGSITCYIYKYKVRLVYQSLCVSAIHTLMIKIRPMNPYMFKISVTRGTS